MNNPNTPLQYDSVWSPLFQQQAFRALMTAFSFPGRPQQLPLGFDVTGPTCIAAVLCDNEVTLADPDKLIQPDDIQRLGIGEESVEKAEFIIADGNRAPTFEPALGCLAEPEQGATLIVHVASVDDSAVLPLTLKGPGIDGTQPLAVRGLHAGWLTKRAHWNRNFPMGVDLILVDSTQVVALPRTTQIDGGVN